MRKERLASSSVRGRGRGRKDPLNSWDAAAELDLVIIIITAIIVVVLCGEAYKHTHIRAYPLGGWFDMGSSRQELLVWSDLGWFIGWLDDYDRATTNRTKRDGVGSGGWAAEQKKNGTRKRKSGRCITKWRMSKIYGRFLVCWGWAPRLFTGKAEHRVESSLFRIWWRAVNDVQCAISREEIWMS